MIETGFISCVTVFDETSIIFYSWLMCRSDIVGFTLHVSSHDLGLKNVPVGLVDVEGNGFMSVYLRTPLFPKEVFDNEDELFGDLSLHRKDKLDTHMDGPKTGERVVLLPSNRLRLRIHADSPSTVSVGFC